MSLSRRKRSQKLSLTGRVLFLTILLGIIVPSIMTAPIRTPLIPKTQATTMMEKDANRNHDEGTMTWVKTYRGTREESGRCGEQTANSGYISPSYILPSTGEENVWLSKVSNQIGIEPIFVDSDYVLDSDLTFIGDGFIIEADDVTLYLNGHTITGSGRDSGVYLNGRTGVSVKNGTINDFSYGIRLHNSSRNTLFGITATNKNNNFYLTDSSENTLSGNTATGSTSDGFYMANSNKTTLSGNTATDNTGRGFALYRSSENTLSGNTATSNADDGFLLVESSDNILSGNTATGNRGTGIEGNGFHLRFSSDKNTLSGNTATDNIHIGFRLDESSNNTLSGNTATGNDHYGFELTESSGTTLTGNTATDNGNCEFRLTNSHDNTISGNTATGGDGFFLYSCSNNFISGNTATDNRYEGFLLRSSHDNTLDTNTATNNRRGFILDESFRNTLRGNTATGNEGSGISLTDNSNENTLDTNTATNNQRGFSLSRSHRNILRGNTVTGNDDFGITLDDYSNDNAIFNNYFDNDHNARDMGTNNRWNIEKNNGPNIIEGSYLGGNFWSDYPGGDADGDGFGDTPYTIPGFGTNYNQDDLPLFDPTLLGAFPIPGGVISLLFATLLLVIFPVRRGKRKSR